MLNTINIILTKNDGSSRAVLIDPVLDHENENDLQNSGIYKLYKSADDESFFTEPLLSDKTAPQLDDQKNPDYLGKIIFADNKTSWRYEGDLLSPQEQQQVVDHINNL